MAYNIPKDLQKKIEAKIALDILSYMFGNATVKNNGDGTSTITIPDPDFEDVYPEFVDNDTIGD